MDNVYHGGDNRCLVLEVEVEAELREAPQLKVVGVHFVLSLETWC